MSKLLTIINSHGIELPVWTIDFETYYNTKEKYSLSAKGMTTTLYVRDERFRAHGLSYITPEGYKGWTTHTLIQDFFDSIDWSKHAMLCQNCLTGDHEVLTESGWVRLDALSGNERVLQWNPDNSEASFTDYLPVKKHHDDVMYSWNSMYHQGIYTGNHRAYYTTPHVTKWRDITIEELTKLGPNNVYIPTAAAKLNNTVQFDFSIDQARFIEMVRADGSYTQHKGKIYGIRLKFIKQSKIKRCLSLLDNLNLSYNEKTSTMDDRGIIKQYTSFYLNISENPWLQNVVNFLDNKHYSSNILNISTEAQCTILDEVLYWDSYKTQIFSASNQDMTWLQTIAALNNKTLRIAQRANNRGFSKADGVLYTGTLRLKHRAKIQYKPTIKHFTGLVYCVSVPTKAFFVRRNGAIWITGNCMFDSFIAKEHYNTVPAYYLDTMCMSLGEWNAGMRHSLNHICERLDIKGKLKGELEKTDGVPYLSPHQEEQLIPYAIQDVVSTREAFEKLYFDRGYPENELHVIDHTIRMFADPVLEINAAICRAEIEAEDLRMENLLKSDVIQGAELSPEATAIFNAKGIEGMMRSRDCFAELLRSRGIEPPMKERKSKGEIVPGEYTYAFAKDDAGLIAIADDPRVSDLVSLWTGSKSTIRKTRAQNLLKASADGTKPLPVPLKYCGARTKRWSGCLTASNYVIVKCGDIIKEVSIKDVLPTDLVWDGEEFVSHDGVVYSGEQEVITYAGITGTKNHPVWVDGKWVDLGVAKNENLCITPGRTPFKAWYKKGIFWAMQIYRSHGSILRSLWHYKKGFSPLTFKTKRQSTPKIEPTYDILNCGPRHRFMANGIIVHNSENLNLQNLNSGRDGRGSRLRESIRAPKGYRIAAPDLSQVELRCSAWVAKELELLEDLRLDRDPYSKLATEIFGVPVSKKNENKHLRHVGKEGELSLGFGVGANKFFNTIQTKYGESVPDFTFEMAEHIVQLYRNKRVGILKVWRDLSDIIHLMAINEANLDYSVFNIRGTTVYLPSGLPIHYTKLHYKQSKFDTDGNIKERGGYVYNYGKDWSYFYGGKFYENLIQAMARDIVAYHLVEIGKEFRILSTVHDELLVLVPEAEADAALARCIEIMRKPPSWCDTIPLDAEGSHNEFYTK